MFVFITHPPMRAGNNAEKAANVRIGSMLLKKSFSTADQNFSRPLMRFSDKYVRDLIS
jgi:hypothetical protein